MSVLHPVPHASMIPLDSCHVATHKRHVGCRLQGGWQPPALSAVGPPRRPGGHPWAALLLLLGYALHLPTQARPFDNTKHWVFDLSHVCWAQLDSFVCSFKDKSYIAGISGWSADKLHALLAQAALNKKLLMLSIHKPACVLHQVASSSSPMQHRRGSLSTACGGL